MADDIQNTNPEQTGERTFTQDEVNHIVGERLAKEKAKGEAALAEREQQLAQRELLLTAKERLNELGLPTELVDALNVSSSEAMEKSLKILHETYSQHAADARKTKLSGVTPAMGTGKVPDSNFELRQAFGLPG